MCNSDCFITESLFYVTPAHTSASTKSFLVQKLIGMLKNWPSQSPNLNIIKHMWSKLKERFSFKQFNSVNELFEAAKTEWMNIDTKYIQNLYESIPSRVRKVISHKGGWMYSILIDKFCLKKASTFCNRHFDVF